MRYPLAIAAFLSLAAIACERSPHGKPPLKDVSQEKLHDDATGTLSLTTHYTDEPVMGLPVWQVWWKATASGTPTALFTVERAFQESEPGAPTFDNSTGEPTLHDGASSYVYSLRQRAFIRNSHPQSVYAGAYQR